MSLFSFAALRQHLPASPSSLLLRYLEARQTRLLHPLLFQERFERIYWSFTTIMALLLCLAGSYLFHLSSLLADAASSNPLQHHLLDSAAETWWLGLFLLLLIPLFGFFSALLRKIFSWDMQQIATILQRVACGDLNARISLLPGQHTSLHKDLGYLINHLAATLQVQEVRIHNTMEGLQKARDRSEAAYRAKSEFLANITHELRTPLHGILSFANFGLKRLHTVPPEKLAYYFSQIRESGSRLLELLNDLLDLSKMEAGRMRYEFAEQDLCQLIGEVLQSQEAWLEEKRLTVRFEPGTVSGLACCDRTRISQVVRNLLHNAIKFSPAEQSIEVTLRATTLPLGRRATDTVQVPALAVRIRDYGVGIPPGEWETIFDKFVQSSKTNDGSGGTGLGLAICQEIIFGHRGKIFAETDLTQGTAMQFIIPRERVSREEAPGSED
ncbi:MAG: HAMP domain-containing histidine kinase [Magnetococcales bacterium]|nr:HAMP domain-containing histidine kinase [Magnetococcales bacterium]